MKLNRKYIRNIIKIWIQNMPYSSDFSHPEKEEEFIRGTQVCVMVLKYLPVKFNFWPMKGK